MIELGIGLAGIGPPSALAEAAERIEAAGFDVLSVFGDLGFQPPIPALLTAAQRTRRIRLGPACLNPYTTHPVEIASQIAYLDAASGGRAYLGLARGAWLERIGVEQPRPLAAIRESAEIVRRLLAGDTSGYAGRAFRIEPGFGLRHRGPRAAVPLLIGGWGPRVIELAGELADELKLGGTANPSLVEWARGHLDAGAARGLEPARATRIVVGAVTVIDGDGERAQARARVEIAMYIDVVGGLDPTLAVDPELLGRLHALLASGAAEAAGRLLPVDLLHRFALVGTPAEVAAHIRRLREAGAHRVELGPPLGADGLRPALEMIRRRLLPELR